MPTAARLIAAICLASLAYILSQMIMPLMPDGTYFGYFVPTNMLLGVLVGWVILGPQAAGTIWHGVSTGLTGVFILVLWGLSAQAVLEMLNRSLDRRYDGLGKAVEAVITLGAEYFLVMATVPIAITLVVGGILSGLLTNAAARRWR